MTVSISAPPYFDDYDETKNYQAILYKPGRAVQTRELNQTQTILQNQIGRFGDSIYTSGSVVSGGKTFVDNNVMSVKLLPTYGGSINVAPLVGLYGKGQTSGLIALIALAVPISTSNPNTLIYRIINGGTNAGLFIDNELINFYTDQACTVSASITVQVATGSTSSTTLQGNMNNNYVTVASATNVHIGDRLIATTIAPNTYVTSIVGNVVYLNNPIQFNIASGTAATFSTDNSQPTSLVSISEGIYYVDGYFLEVQPQSLYLDLYKRSSSYIVGLTYNYVIVTSDDDSTLLDNASGTSNYNAIGADRLKIPLVLTKLPLTDDEPANLTTSNFFELLRVSNGTLLSQNNLPIYSELNQTMARRTYDESGNYVVKNFGMTLDDDSLVSTALVANMSPGKAYVRGNQINKLATTPLRVDRALATQSVTSFDVSSFYGAYALVNPPTQSIPQFATGQLVEIHNVTSGYSSGTKIGTANVRYIAYNSGSGSSVVYQLYLFNIVLTGTNTFASALSFITTAVSGVYSSITINLAVASSGIVGGATQLYNSSYKSSLFEIPQSFISTVPLVEYTTKRVFKGVAFSNGVATINGNNQYEQFLGGSGVIPSVQAVAYYTVVATSTSGTYTAGQFIPLDLSSRTVTIPTLGAGIAGQATINLNDNTFNGTCDIEASLQLSNDTRRVKTLVTNSNLNVTTPTSSISLGKADVYSIVGIYDSGNPSIAATTSSTNVTSHYALDNGQRDTHYDFGNINLIAGFSAPTGQLLIVFDYFTHTGGTGYLTVDSYPLSYGNIPTYTDSTGAVHQLRDCIDFRPRRVDGSTTETFQTAQMPDPTFVVINESYYMSRIDKIVMTSSGQFKVVSGIPAYTNPQPPADLPDAMTLYTLVLPPYTIDASDVTIIASNNRRYTMNDIAALDSRLTNVEAYTALNLLEQTVTNTTLTNLSGTTLYQNGFLVDPFIDFTVADGGNADFRASIDTVNNCARAQFTLANVAMNYYPTGSTSTQTGNLVTAPYTNTPYVTQTLATKYLNINPYNVFSNVGILTLSPNTDTWYDTTQLPVIKTDTITQSALAVAQSSALKNNQSAMYGEWNNFNTPPSNSVNTFGIANNNVQAQPQSSNTVTTYTVTSSSSVASTVTEPYMRAANIEFNVTGLTPFATIYTWMDDVNISAYVTPGGALQQPHGVTGYSKVSGGTGYTSSSVITITITGGGTGATANYIINPDTSLTLLPRTYGTGYTTMPTVVVTATGGGSGASFTATNANIEGMPIITDIHGAASGMISIPDNSTTSFVSGQHIISLSDNTNNPITATSYASATYTAQGYMNYDQTVISTQETIHPVLPPTPKVHIPAATPTIPTFADSSLTAAQLTAQIIASGGYTSADTATVTAMVNSVLGAYTSNPISQSNPARTVVDTSGTVLATGLPDVEGAEWWVTNALKNGLSTTQAAAQVAQGFVTNTAQEAQGVTAATPDGTKTATVLDPLAQSIFVDATRNPEGVFVSALDLYFASKDTINPCYVEIRTMDNGYPTSVVIPYSQITVMPSSITTSTDGTVATNVVFPSPVYLAPGQYAIVLKSNSNMYNMFIGVVGQVLLSQNATVTAQPYIGSLFESQNASTWIATGGANLCFVLYKCNFALGTTNFYLNATAPASETYYDIINLRSQELNFSGTTSLSAQIATTPVGGGLSSYIPFTENVDYNFNTRQEITNANDLMVNYSITTQSNDVSPVLDLSRSAAILIANVINQSSSWTIPETTAFGGSASAKYVSKKVVLAPGMSADNLVVYLNVNRPAGTGIQVYYKVQNQFDTTTFLNLPWVLMSQELNGGNTSQAGAVVEDKWSAYGISYVNSGTTYHNFDAFQIKIVMTSSNVSYSPSIYDLREIATA